MPWNRDTQGNNSFDERAMAKALPRNGSSGTVV